MAFIRDTFPEATDEQVKAIQAQAALYRQRWIEAIGVLEIGRAYAYDRDGALAADYTYAPESGSRAREVAVFAPDGSITDRPVPGAVAEYNARKGRP